jgi:hypothetical protein
MTRMATADIYGAVTFVPDAGGTRMSWSWDLRPKGMLKLATPLFAAAGRRQEKRKPITRRGIHGGQTASRGLRQGPFCE